MQLEKNMIASIKWNATVQYKTTTYKNVLNSFQSENKPE